MSTFTKRWLYRYGLSFIFSVIVVLAFYLIDWLIPSDTSMRNEIVTVIFIVISVLLLFPIRKKFLYYFLRKDIYSSLSGFDFTNLDFSELPFNIEALVRTNFPELMSWLGISSASLSILEPNRMSYRVYLYHKKKLIDEATHDRKTYDKLCRYLGEKADNIFLEDENLPDDIHKQMESLHVTAIYPLLYRSFAIGFFTFRETPSLSSIHAKQVIAIFSNRAVLSVQNYILSNRVIDTRIYDNELKLASRIRKALERPMGPQIPSYEIKRLPTERPFVFEFFKIGPRRWVFVALFCNRFSDSSGILIYSILGRLYSSVHLLTHITLARLASNMKNSLNWQYIEYSIHTLFMELNEDNKQLKLFTNTKGFSVQNQATEQTKNNSLTPKKINVTNGRYTHTQIKDKRLNCFSEVLFQDIPFLQISTTLEKKAANP